MTISEIRSHIEAIKKNSLPYKEKNFDERINAIDILEFQLIDRLQVLQQRANQPHELFLLKDRAENVKAELEAMNTRLFQKLRANIRAGIYTEENFKNLVSEYVDVSACDNARRDEPGYDNLDIFINGLLSFSAMPEPARELELEMVYYQKTPARLIFEMVEQSHITNEDVFFDLGSGLGQVAILVNLLTGIKTIGLEFEPAFYDYACACTTELNLPGVTFINTDARKADYSEGTIFFMYTPFSGEMLQEVLELLRKESMKRKIKVITYGPCTAKVASQTWLRNPPPVNGAEYKLAVFSNL